MLTTTHQTVAFRRGYWDGLAGRHLAHRPPYAEQSALEEYEHGLQRGLADRVTKATHHNHLARTA